MKLTEASRQARTAFEYHCSHCQECMRYEGTTNTLAKLCYKGMQLYRDTVDPQRFAGQRKHR